MTWSNQAVSLMVLVEATSGYSGIFGYSPEPGPGTLIFSVAAAAGTDPYGNPYPAGISTTAGGSTIKGADYVIDNAGAFWYSGTPAFGNLIVAIANAAGSDPFGNSYAKGISISAGAIDGGQINAGTISTSQLGTRAVTTSKLANNAVTATQIANATITGTQLAASVTARSLGGITTTISATAPLTPNTGDIWINSANGNQLQQWSGSAWQPITWTATDVISAATITASLIAASTITGGNIAAGTITASNIAAGTITAAQIAAGVVIAGIVNGTTITGATIIADGTSGQFLVYSGTPAFGNLVASVSGSAGSDGFGNSYVEGVGVYDNVTGGIGQLDSGQVMVTSTTAGGSGTLSWAGASLSGIGGSSRNIAETTAIDTSGLQTLVDVIAPIGTGGTQNGIVAVYGWEPTGAVVLPVSVAVDGGITVSSAGGQQLILTSTSTPGTPISQIAAPAAGNEALGISVTGDTNDRLLIDSAGKHSWGNGTAGVDTNLYRASANNLQTDDNFTASGTVTAGGIASLNAGSNTASGATVRTPGFANGTPSQLTDTTRDYMIYFQIGTAGSAFSIKIGAGNPPGNTIYTSATPTAGEFISFRLPAGWFVQWGGTSTTLASQKAVGC